MTKCKHHRDLRAAWNESMQVYLMCEHY
jgi:hypothetical protein